MIVAMGLPQAVMMPQEISMVLGLFVSFSLIPTHKHVGLFFRLTPPSIPQSHQKKI